MSEYRTYSVTYVESLVAVVEAAREFCDRRDKGEVHSTYTYNKFKEALAALEADDE